MDRNTENHFANLPSTNIGRSKFTRNFTHKTTFNTGDLFVIDWQEILPGDTVNMNMSSLVRLQTPIAPVIDNLYLDTYWFFVPNRLTWDNWVNFMGENTNEWAQTIDYQVPQMRIGGSLSTASNCVVDKGSLCNYMGIPIGLGAVANTEQNIEAKTITVNALPFRAYCKIWNDWFRETSTQKELYFPRNSTTVTSVSKKVAEGQDDKYTQFCYRGAACARANKFHDVFTSCLPEPQEGPMTYIPMLGDAPIKSKEFKAEYEDTEYTYGTNSEDLYSQYYMSGLNYIGTVGELKETTGEHADDYEVSILDGGFGKLYADLTNALGASVSALRMAFSIQRFYEATARGGNRYIEQIQTHFGTTNPDFRLQRSEYLGGATRIPVSINQVLQTVGDQTSPLGNTGAYSVTSDVSNDMWTHSFTEHGILMCVAVARTDHTYQQGIAKKFFRKNIFDYYWPALANISEQPIYVKELYAQDGTTDAIDANEQVFGYQEAYSEYRYEKDIVTGELSSMYAQSEDIWHYADYYSDAPTLNAEWMRETPENVKRTLTYQDGDQFIGDFYIKGTWTRPMPLYSIPGLSGHY